MHLDTFRHLNPFGFYVIPTYHTAPSEVFEVSHVLCIPKAMRARPRDVLIHIRRRLLPQLYTLPGNAAASSFATQLCSIPTRQDDRRYSTVLDFYWDGCDIEYILDRGQSGLRDSPRCATMSLTGSMSACEGAGDGIQSVVLLAAIFERRITRSSRKP
jgi:hypothetical protein